ncbi:Rieske (2Fe-2S) protein [Streptomyces sp. JJ66]|uniref:QcrA and Rieske domain-containing protein n=1 Tax=Streptomyces sp. JJ66 TaxID=2803843 RepID=UPI001C5718F7|nr:Rieske (2Fe-2S) protein [Streptomyces sp. JJ66]MBW1602887.1 Rieske (2Fe-2S) protein [Streptomyces sp. JJ66]
MSGEKAHAGPRPGRRAVLRGAAVTAAGAAGLSAAGCAGADGPPPEPPSEPVTLGPASKVGVGEAQVFPGQNVLVSQPEAGTYRAFSAVCTHKQCPIPFVERQEAVCTCHGSRFDVMSGEVRQGPATRPLPPVPIQLDGDDLVAG